MWWFGWGDPLPCRNQESRQAGTLRGGARPDVLLPLPGGGRERGSRGTEGSCPKRPHPNPSPEGEGALDPRLRGDEENQRSAVPAATTLSLLTLGQCLPVFGMLPQATWFREELAELGQDPHLHWTDFSAPPDASCFPLCDPMSTLKVPGPPPLPDHPKLLSPKFAEMFDAAGYGLLKSDKFRMHFQYLMASAKPVEYDYFRITAGARTLQERYAHLPSVVNFTTLRPFG